MHHKKTPQKLSLLGCDANINYLILDYLLGLQPLKANSPDAL